MTSNKEQQDPFFMVFPWGKVAGISFLFVFGLIVVYRLSESCGPGVNQACLLAMIVAGVAGIPGIYAIGKTWGGDLNRVVVGIMVAVAIRLLIGGVGLAIILFFTNVDRRWFVLFLVAYYLAFLAIDTWFALWMLRHSDMKNQEQNTL